MKQPEKFRQWRNKPEFDSERKNSDNDCHDTLNALRYIEIGILLCSFGIGTLLETMELSSAVDLITGKVVSLIEHEASLLTKVGAEIKEIKLELKAMKAFLDHADRGSGVVASNETDNQWVENVRDIAYEVEDVIHEFMCHSNKQQQWRGIKWLSSYNVSTKGSKALQRETNDTEFFCSGSRKFIEQIGGENDRNNWVKNLSEPSLFHKDDDLVGIDKAQRELLGWLMDQELQRTMTSVVGMGGLGKTTLVANTFNKQVVKQHFECCAWITVSQQYVVIDLFKSMIKELHDKSKEKIDQAINLESMSYRELVEALVNFLEPRRYLIVIDDVWSIKFWQDISIALPINMNGSRILLKTRMEDVASFEFGAVNHIHRLKPLPFDESLALFWKKAFVGKGGQCPPYLVSSSRKLVAKCEGLPLAIVALGGLMASKNSISEWNEVYNNLNRELKDYVIKRKRLLRLWIAEGFVEPQKETIPEVVAERCVTELIGRGILQVVRRSGSERLKECKTHDILREFAVSISKSIKFVGKSDGKEEIEDNGIRRWSIEAKEKEMKAASKPALSRVRSLLVFAVSETSKTSFNRLPSGSKFMRVLDLEGTPINELPDELVILFNSSYLNLTRTQVKEFPKSIGRLYNLQFLIMKETEIKELPAGIVKLKNLQYLITYRFSVNRGAFDFSFGIVVSCSICLLTNIQALFSVEARGDFIKQLSKMTQLRRLGVSSVKETDEKDLCFAIAKMIYLRYLFVKSCNEDEQLKMDALESAPPDLEKLWLAGKLEKVPHWFNLLDKLTFLCLYWSRLRDDFLPHIQALPNLGHLDMLNAYEGDRLDFLEGFQKLKIIRIRACPRLKEIVINDGVMPGLQELTITDCHEFATLPQGWESLPDLNQVALYNLSPGLIEKIWRSKRVDQRKITGITLSRQEGAEAVFNITRWSE
ncbi:hypothetical protein V6N11_083429 [Hibiscus sabdariffa]|uniref:Uncharacterized protein n=1 Tax=Hibiscus sabdariffa TaxID=183260 RepID=A0ABR2QLU9_9ROSI